MPEIIVCIKQIYDLGQIRIDATSKHPILEGVSRKLSDFDRNALEEAVRIREKYGGKVIALIGGTKDAAKEAMAMGADEAIFFRSNQDSLGTASILSGIIQKMKYAIILCGEASIDEYSFQTGPRIGDALGIPVFSYVRKVELKGDEIIVERELENRYEVAKSMLPALVTVTREINEPRIPTLLQILAASKKKMTEIEPGKVEDGIQILGIEAIEMKRKEIVLRDAGELAKIIISERG
jgi:electron transfer flavoprotein beta subunit